MWFSNSWKLWLGIKPFGRHANLKNGIEIELDAFHRGTWLRLAVSVISCTLFVLGCGYDIPKVRGAIIGNPAYWFTVGLIGFFFHWTSCEQYPEGT